MKNELKPSSSSSQPGYSDRLLAAHGAERSKTALALLPVAEDLLMSGRYTAAKRSPVQFS